MKYPKNRNRTSYKFMQSLSHNTFIKLKKLADSHDITIQDYIRAIVVPSYLLTINSPKYSQRVKKGWETRRKKQEELELAAKNEEFPPFQPVTQQ